MFEIGSALRDARVRRNISLQQAEDETKIRIKYIQAMENEDFDVLPSGTYVKGFLRTYADYLGIDFQVILDEYYDRFGAGESRDHMIQPPKTIKTKTPHKRQSYVFVAIFAVAIIAVLAYLGWGNSSSPTPTLVTTTETQPTTATAPAAAAPEAAPPAPTPTVPTQTVPQTIESLTFQATTSDNWIEVHKDSANGPVVWGGTLFSGQSKSLNAEMASFNKAWLRIGSAKGLVITVNGKLQTISEKVGELYLITPAGLTKQ